MGNTGTSGEKVKAGSKGELRGRKTEGRDPGCGGGREQAGKI